MIGWLAVLGCGAAGTTVSEVPEVALPSVPSAVLRAPAAVEVVVSSAGIYVDPRPWYAAVPSESVRPIGPGLVLALAGWKPSRPFPHELAVPY
nr:hypothetical protein [Deltaproteobacteria bacterium]